VFSATYAEPNGVFGADSALSFPNFFPKFSAGSVSLAVELTGTNYLRPQHLIRALVLSRRISFRLIPRSDTAPIFAEWLRSVEYHRSDHIFLVEFPSRMRM
jgi:hypothetical protein